MSYCKNSTETILKKLINWSFLKEWHEPKGEERVGDMDKLVPVIYTTARVYYSNDWVVST